MAKILILTWNFPPRVGGIENLMEEIYESLNRKHDVSVITAGNPERENDAKVRRVSSDNVMVFMAKSLFATMRLLRKGNFDMILAGSLLVNPVAVLCGALFSVPVVSMSYGLDIIYSNPLYQLWIRSFWNRNRAVIAISENSRRLLLERGLSPSRPVILHPGVSKKIAIEVADATLPEQIRERYGIGDRPCLVSVGRLTKRKGIYPFVRQCLPSILREIPECVFLIVGEDPRQALVHRTGESTQIQDAVRDMGLGSNVLFMGKVDNRDLHGIYRAGDLFVFPVVDVPNDVEGFGMVAIEAAIAGKPSVASNIGGIPDAVQDGVSGILVKPGDYDSFAAAVVSLLRDRELRERLGSQARERAISRFTWDVLGEKWNEMVTDVTGVSRKDD